MNGPLRRQEVDGGRPLPAVPCWKEAGDTMCAESTAPHAHPTRRQRRRVLLRRAMRIAVTVTVLPVPYYALPPITLPAAAKPSGS